MLAILALPEVAEFPALAGDGDALLAAARDGQKPLLEHLKAMGVAKMGQRQKLAKAIRDKLDEGAGAPEAPALAADDETRDKLVSAPESPAPAAAAPAADNVAVGVSMLDVSDAAPSQTTPSEARQPEDPSEVIRTLSCREDYDTMLREAGAQLVALSFVCAPHVLTMPQIIKEMKIACKQTWAAFDQLAGSGKFPFVQFAKLDVDDDVKTAQACGITVIPTFHLYRYGKKIGELAGHHIDGAALRALLLEHGGPPVTLPAKAAVLIVGRAEQTELAQGKVELAMSAVAPGQRGYVQGFDPSTGRYQVELGEVSWPGQKLEVVELERAQMVLAARVSLRALEGEELPAACSAGGSATICGFDVHTHAYEVTLDGGSPVRLPLSCVVLPTSTAGVIVGLKGAPQHNGKAGLLVEYDEAADRYVVALDRTSNLRLKRANFRA
jgi:hypothetical protein